MSIRLCPQLTALSRLCSGGLVAAALAWGLAGCASGPGKPVGGVARGGAVASVPAVTPRTGPAPSGERDGPPVGADVPSAAVLAALPDPVPQVEPIREGGPNKPYTVLGQSYAPITKDEPLKERGVVSWYGNKFHGRRTASGELFSMYGITAAHRTLPIPSYARVTDLKSGKSVIVRVNDRGPFHSNRVMDLSYAAAVKLGVASRGSAEVEVERLTFDAIRTGAWRRDDELANLVAAPVVPPAPTLGSLPAATVGVPAAPVLSPAPGRGPVAPTEDGMTVGASTRPAGATPTGDAAKASTPFARGFWVQLAALGRRDGVEKLQQRIAAELQNLLPMLAVFHEAAYFKLQVGPFASREEALAAADQAKATLSVSPLVIERR